ncbi:MAG: (d)CMP kinase [Pseudomonadota bacterium]
MIQAVPVLTIDGPSGAGKGTVSSRVAKHLGWHLLDSGAVYRAVAVRALDQGMDPQRIGADEEQRLIDMSRSLDLEFSPAADGIEVLLAGEVINHKLRTEAASVMASKSAAIPEVREALLQLQRDSRRAPGLVADGRDMGTVVFPDAGLKVFLDASVEERAQRRYKQLKQKGESVILARLFRDMLARDRRDRERAVAPTVPATDAVVIDSTDLSLDQVVDTILRLTFSGPEEL